MSIAYSNMRQLLITMHVNILYISLNLVNFHIILHLYSTEFFVDVCQRAILTRAIEYVEDNAANFVFQTVLRRLVSVFQSGVIDSSISNLVNKLNSMYLRIV